MTDSRTRRLAGWAAGTGALAALGFRLAGLPLLEAPGWELGMVAALLAVVAAPPLGISAARQELSRGRPAPLRAFARASAGLLLLQAALVGGAAARTAFFTPCSLSHGLAFVPAVALPSALAAAALSTLAGFLARGRPLRGALLYLAGVVASLGTTLLEGWLGPSSYLLDHLLGIWPGPIYDEALSLDRRLLLFRLGSLAWTAALLGVAQLVAVRRRTPPGRARGAAIGIALALFTVGSIRLVGASTGDLATRGSSTGSWAAASPAPCATSTIRGRSPRPRPSGSSGTARPTWRRCPPRSGSPLHPW